MKVEQSIVKKLTITDVLRLDPVTVILEDFELGKGKIIIECYGKSWSSYWGAMGGRTVGQFFIDCDEGYLISNLAPGINSRIIDNDALEDHVKDEIIKLRRERDVTKTEARDLYERADGIEDSNVERRLLHDVFGDEWWYRLPETENPDYAYLCRIVGAVQDGIKAVAAQSVVRPVTGYHTALASDLNANRDRP